MDSRKAEADKLRVLGRVLAGAVPQPGLDWRSMAEVARRQGASPLLYWRIRQLEAGGAGEAGERPVVPPDVHEDLRKNFYATAARVMVAEQQLAAILKALVAAEVPALVIKGAAAGAFYPNAALRAYGDLDLLVPRALVDRAEAALNAEGYQRIKSKTWALEYGYDLPMTGSDQQIMVEIHWRLDYPEGLGHLPIEEVWQRAVPWTVEGQEALRLEDVDAVLYLCVHALLKHHAHLGLRPVSDLVYVVRDWSPERWQALVSRAVAYCLSRPVYLMLVLMEELFGLAPPREVSAALRPPGGDALPGDLVERLLVRNGTQAVVVPRAAVQAGAKGGTAAGLRHFLWHTFLPREGMAHKYGIPAASPRIWLTYLWRPIDLLRRYGDSAWKSLRRDETVRAAWDREAWLEQWLHGVGSGE